MERKVDRSGQKGNPAPQRGRGDCSAAGALPASPMGPGRFCEASEGKASWIQGSCVLCPPPGPRRVGHHDYWSHQDCPVGET